MKRVQVCCWVTMLPMKRASGFAGDLMGNHAGLFSTISSSGTRRSKLFGLLPWALFVTASFLLLLNRPHPPTGLATMAPNVSGAATKSRGNIFVSYSYFEKDGIQVRMVCYVFCFMASGTQRTHRFGYRLRNLRALATAERCSRNVDSCVCAFHDSLFGVSRVRAKARLCIAYGRSGMTAKACVAESQL